MDHGNCRKHETIASAFYSENRMVHLIPGCPGSTAEFWGKKYWKHIRGKSIELGQRSSNIRISQVAPQYFYDYCYVYEWVDRYDISSRHKLCHIMFYILRYVKTFLAFNLFFICQFQSEEIDVYFSIFKCNL